MKISSKAYDSKKRKMIQLSIDNEDHFETD